MRVVRRRIAKVFSKVYEEETGTYYYYNAQTGETSWSKPLVLGSQDIDEGRLVGGDGRLLADDRSEVADSARRVGGSLMPREWPRSKSQRLVDAAEDDPRGATILKLGGLGLPRVTFRALSIETLTELDVSDNRLSRLQKDFGGLFNLEVLDVSGNRLRTFPRELQDLDKLRVLRASKNRIAWFPAHLWQLGALEELDLCENVLVELPMEVGNLALLQETRVWELDSLKNLETLDLSKNDLAHMAPVRVAQSEEQKTAAVKPGEVAIGAPDPKQCDWAGLALEKLDDALKGLRALKLLSAPRNGLRSVTAEIAQLRFVKQVDLDGNELASLPKEITQLRSCERLTFAKNRLAELPKGFGSMFRLQALVLRSNKFDKIDGDLLASLVSLTELDFSDNAVAVFPKKLCRLGKLTRLDLSRNKLWFVPKEIRSLGELKFFHLHENRLKTADMSRAEFATLKALEVLTLHDNYLEELPPEFADLPRLRKLTMSHNPCAAEVHAALAPFVDGLRVRATPLRVRAAFRPQTGGRRGLAAAAGRYRAATLTGASQGAEKLERGDVAEAVAPLVAAADAHARLVVDEPHAATVSHHVHLGAARVSIAKQRRALAEADKFERLERDRKARREEELRKRAEEEAAAEEEEDDDDDDAPKFLLLEAKKALDAAEHLDLTHRRAGAAAVEIYYLRGLAAYELDDARQAIYDLDDALALRPAHAPSLALRAKARCALGQFPEGKRDCLKAKRLLLTERGLNMPEPDEQAPRAVAAS
ncbi:hypothetical protein JL722_11288 [Aureococcus anophagefferens]|nr:hypothetical protein JL722_11288 [Aureococcus anophagefferens]